VMTVASARRAHPRRLVLDVLGKIEPSLGQLDAENVQLKSPF
jgi:hypothetical protein